MEYSYNYEEILEWHPEMVLVSESPVTWKGFLVISSLYATCHAHCLRVKLKLVMPNYPSFYNMQISFGRHIAFLRNREFSKKVKELIKTAQRVPLFLTELQSLIVKYMHDTHSSKICMIDFELTRDFLQDIKAVLQNPSDVQLSCDWNFSTIKLSLKGVSLTLQRCNSTETPWKIVSSDMPTIPAFKSFEKNVTNLSVAMTKFKWQVELLERAWEQLKEIDENCWVIDPSEPNKSHMYRRIHLSQSISVTITIDPLDPTAVPKIKFSGSDNEVKRQMDDVSNNICNWNQDCNILENLRMLLNMCEFPEQQESLDDSKGIIGNCECGICFSEKSETDELSNKICNNEKCLKHFHSACLSKKHSKQKKIKREGTPKRWLQVNAGNQVVFGHIYGTCPHCKENISCPIE